MLSSGFTHVRACDRISQRGNGSMYCCRVYASAAERRVWGSLFCHLGEAIPFWLLFIWRDSRFLTIGDITFNHWLQVNNQQISPSWRNIFYFVNVKTSVWWYFGMCAYSFSSNFSFSGASICWWSLPESMITLGLCYGLNVCVVPKFIYWFPNPQCIGIWRWGPWR